MHTVIKNGYVLFWNGPFSNFDPVENGIVYADLVFPDSEHIFMFEKANHFGDHETAEKILAAKEPLEAKRLGRTVKGFTTEAWEPVRYDYMLKACRAKFAQSATHRIDLLRYGSHGKFVEASPYDKVWGIGLEVEHRHAADPKYWRGLNLLGKVLDQVYSETLLKG